jgi:hypothetical protein
MADKKDYLSIALMITIGAGSLLLLLTLLCIPKSDSRDIIVNIIHYLVLTIAIVGAIFGNLTVLAFIFTTSLLSLFWRATRFGRKKEDVCPFSDFTKNSFPDLIRGVTGDHFFALVSLISGIRICLLL